MSIDLNNLVSSLAELSEEETSRLAKERQQANKFYSSEEVSGAFLEALFIARQHCFSLAEKPIPNFFQTMVQNFTFVHDPKVDLAHIDQFTSTITVNMDEFLSYDLLQRSTIVNHLLWHNAFMHQYELLNLNEKDYQKWNLACDIFVNNNLHNMNFPIPHGFPIWEKYKQDTPKVIFEHLPDSLFDENEKITIAISTQGLGISFNPSSDSASGLNMNGDFLPKGKVDDLSRSLVNQTKDHALSRLKGLFDELSKNMDLNEKSCSLFGLSNEFKRISKLFEKPAVDWKTYLAQYIKELSSRKGQRTFKRINPRREEYHGFRAKGNLPRHELRSLNVLIDVSGSVSAEEHCRYFTELASIATDNNLKTMEITTFDTQVCERFTLRNYEMKRNIFENMQLRHGGGTCIQPALDFINQKSVHKGNRYPSIPQVLVVFTDMEMEIPKDKYDFPIIWCIVKNERFNENEIFSLKHRQGDKVIIVPDHFFSK